MKRYHYLYVTHSTFTPAVEWHFFKLRAIPCHNEFQHTDSLPLRIMPSCHLYHSTDGQGNAVQWGSYSGVHAECSIEAEGYVEQTAPYQLHEVPAPYYMVVTRLTDLGENAKALTDRIMLMMPSNASPFRLAIRVMHLVHSHIAYTPGHTTTCTTAAEVWADRRGVCQDYAHAMIALCRRLGLHARYACGLIEGEGQTHAWVEVSDGQMWLGFDPTHDRLIRWGYIKIAHGRDASDCPVNRGRIYGWTREIMTVSTLTHTL